MNSTRISRLFTGASVWFGGKAVRIIILVMFLTLSAYAQDQPAVVGAACGPKGVNFAVKLDDSQHRLAQPEPGKARIYFVQQTGAGNCVGACVTRIGLDGAWVGAFKGPRKNNCTCCGSIVTISFERHSTVVHSFIRRIVSVIATITILLVT
jgi:hypothetical protein